MCFDEHNEQIHVYPPLWKVEFVIGKSDCPGYIPITISPALTENYVTTELTGLKRLLIIVVDITTITEPGLN